MTAPPMSSPSMLAVAVGSTLIGGITGFFLGQASTIGVFGSSSKSQPRPTVEAKAKAGGKVDLTDKPGAHDSDSEDEDDDESDDEQEMEAYENEGGECKLTLVVRTDLGMGKGKIAAQCSHATLACYRSLQASTAGQSILRRWERYGQAKVALRADSEDELQILQAQAVSLGVCAKIIQDAGRTQIEAGSSTVLGVGPAPKAVVDQITGGLKLM